jgi:hypothetical protein
MAAEAAEEETEEEEDTPPEGWPRKLFSETQME